MQAIDFYNGTVEDDIFALQDLRINKNISRVKQVIKSYARNISTQCSDLSILNDVNSIDKTFNNKVLDKYLEILRRLYIIEDLDSWNINLRSKAIIRSKPTRHFVDPSIATSALNITPDGLINDIKTFGLLFERSCLSFS